MRVAGKELAYGLLRVALGLNFLGHGGFRILSGVGAFAVGMAEHMTKSPLPHGMVVGFGYAIPWIELLLGLGLILGVFTRTVLVGGALFMMALTFGTTSNQQWDVAGQQLVYSVVFFGLLYLVEFNRFSIDWLRAPDGLRGGMARSSLQ
ncbi:DoxX family membrane protein [Granulicella tundricola]|uniref:DoxX family protein n=1 Tax=Granulicella tundricola (strain ATCC BAA-1859 / DSM 23138 / MP5ACTX9) TaxID=1198114 RepID=E8X2L9_GRATM|nr:DoxX family membrane protein [Granulicella tundricola]ADW69243.1 DoxX family protein [Granulicella tundricola MP5ACTX9]